ncbi:MAG: thiamine-phosphate kinase [Pseudomonadota bacterium]
MARSEFSLIASYFSRLGAARDDVRLGVGDDAAIVTVAAGYELAIAVDTMVSGVHFFPDTDPYLIGYKLLAVNLSDMAAMGAEPNWMTLALTVPQADEHWLEDFSKGLADLALAHGVQLIGGDTTRGPLTLSLQIHGLVPQGTALMRKGAQPGDLIFVTGTLGDAGLGLKIAQGALTVSGAERDYLLGRLHRPTPRVELGMALRAVATSAIDVSDGLLADLGHILEASGVGAQIQLEQLPLSNAYRNAQPEVDYSAALGGGDDYELCFTAPAQQQQNIIERAQKTNTPITCIGTITPAPGIICRLHGNTYQPKLNGYDHFAET